MFELFMVWKDGGQLQLGTVLFALVALIAITTVVISLWRRVPVPAAVALLPVGGIALIGVVAHLVGAAQLVQGLAHAPPEMKQALAAGGVAVQVAGLVGAGTALSMLGVVGCLLAAGPVLRQPERRWGGAALPVLLGAANAAAALVTLVLYTPAAVVGAQIGLSVIPVLGTAYARTGTGRCARMSATLASALLALSVAGGWALNLASSQADAFQASARAPAELKWEMILLGAEAASSTAALGLLPVLLVILVPWLAAARTAEPDDRPSATLVTGISCTGALLVMTGLFPLLPYMVQP